MRTQLSEEIDEEYDDPIKLFESDMNTVYFGSQSFRQGTVLGTKSLDYRIQNTFCQSKDHSASASLRGTDSECLSQLSVKLVDCGKFPRYFKKYTKRIVEIINPNHDESDTDTDVVELDYDTDDCIIVEDLQDNTNVIELKNGYGPSVGSLNISTVTPQGNRSKLDCMRSKKEDIELQKALSQKNMAKVDFKRNQGLVGLKITRTIIKNPTLDVKSVNRNEDKIKKNTIPDEKYIRAAGKTLTNIGTQLIPIPEKQVNDISCKSKINKEELLKNTTSPNCNICYKIPVKFNLSKMSETLLEKLKPNKSPSKHPDNKTENTAEAITTGIPSNSSNRCVQNVKDVKKTNKYKNDQLKFQNKASHSSLIGVLISQPNEEFNKELKNKDRHIDSQLTGFNKKICKKAQKHKREVNYPISQCSSVTKKPKTNHEVSLKSDKSDTKQKVSKSTGNLNNIVNKLNNINNSKITQSNNVLDKVSSKDDSVVKPDEPGKQVLSKQSCKSQVDQVNAIYSKLLAKHDSHSINMTNMKPNELTNIQHSYNNKTSVDEHLPKDIGQDNMHNHSVTTSEANLYPTFTSVIDNPLICSTSVPTTFATTKSKFNSSPYANFANSFMSQFHAQNTMPRPKVPKNGINNSVYNSYASAIILKQQNHQIPNYPVTCNKPESPIQSRAAQRPNNVPPPPTFLHKHPLFRNQQNLYPNYNKSYPCSKYQNNFQRPQNLATTPHAPPPILPPSFPVPPIGVNVIPNNNVTQNTFNPHSNLPFNPSVPVRQHTQSSSQNLIKKKFVDNSSIIGMNETGFVKKINILAVPITTNNRDSVEIQKSADTQVKNPDVVTTKTEMLEELDKLSFADEEIADLKIKYDDNKVNDSNKTKTFEIEYLSKLESTKPTVNQTKIPMQPIQQSKGYSPPILPIPTYEKLLDQVVSRTQPQNEKPKIGREIDKDTKSSNPNFMNIMKPNGKKYFDKRTKRKLGAFNKPGYMARNDEAKKISLDEYKKRSKKKSFKYNV